MSGNQLVQASLYLFELFLSQNHLSGDTTVLEGAVDLSTLILSSNHLSCDVATLKDQEKSVLGQGETTEVFL